MTDILIIYEHVSRELENCALIAAELERRGYKVKLSNIYSPLKYYIRPKVVIVPHLYDDGQLNRFCDNFTHNNTAIIDMQYEQILGVGVGIDDIHNPKGQAKYAQHISWGKNQTERYINAGIATSNIHELGCVSMDLMRPEFSLYFKTKQSLADELGLDVNKEWVLFISSFSYANLSEQQIKSYSSVSPNVREFSEISTKTQTVLLKWLKEASIMYPDKEFIYRPHPAENDNTIICKMQNELPNFHCIREYSMRQWVHVVDRNYNWFSTSITDVYYSGKSCFILRPFDIPLNMEVEILKNCKTLKTFDEFEESLKNQDYCFPVTKEQIEYYYGNTKDCMSYQKIADLCEKMMKDRNLHYQFVFNSQRNFSLRIKTELENAIKSLYFILCNCFKLQNHFYLTPRYKKLLKKIYPQDVYGANKNFTQYKNKIKEYLENYVQK